MSDMRTPRHPFERPAAIAVKVDWKGRELLARGSAACERFRSVIELSGDEVGTSETPEHVIVREVGEELGNGVQVVRGLCRSLTGAQVRDALAHSFVRGSTRVTKGTCV